jgi:predicted RNA polymerase sigma factor
LLGHFSLRRRGWRSASCAQRPFIRDKAIPYQVPDLQELSARLGAVLQIVYLIFKAGYSAEATRAELSREAIRLGTLPQEKLFSLRKPR